MIRSNMRSTRGGSVGMLGAGFAQLRLEDEAALGGHGGAGGQALGHLDLARSPIIGIEVHQGQPPEAESQAKVFLSGRRRIGKF